MRWWDGTSWTEHVQASTHPSRPNDNVPLAPTSPRESTGLSVTEKSALVAELQELVTMRDRLREEVIDMRDAMLLQEVGIYQYAHPLDAAVAYRAALDDVAREMKICIKEGRAISGARRWVINGSEKDGAKMVADFSKLLLRAYNSEADALVRTMRPYARDASVARLQKLRESISKLGSSMQIVVAVDFHQLRVRELELTSDYLAKVADEKEAERDERARLREEALARREFEREQARLEKERAHYASALAVLRSSGQEPSEIAELEQKLVQIQDAVDGVLRRAANVRAGYVYVISNFGAFGRRVVKIGMTRRLEPMDRVRELGDASVPYRFDVHALIFSDDAVGLETSLHRKFSERRLNLVNTHREFFFVSPTEVRDALVELQGNLLTFKDDADAIEWRQSETLRRKGGALPFEVEAAAIGDDDDEGSLDDALSPA